MITKIALVAAIVLPLWNIPLIVRIIKRKSSKDISIYWAVGVWSCLLAMLPAGLQSEDIVWKVFNIANVIIFGLVVITIVVFRKS